MKITIVSDWHIESKVSQKDKIISFLENLNTNILILNGDIMDVDGTQRLGKKEWKILNLLRKINKTIPVYWVEGNHDPEVSLIIANLLGISHADSFKFTSGGKIIGIEHGHKKDHWVSKKLLTDFFTGLYYFIQLFDTKNRTFSRWIKIKSKQILKVSDKMAARYLDYGKKNGYDIVCVGHSHISDRQEKDDVIYLNSGCWTDHDCTYIEIENGNAEIKTYG